VYQANERTITLQMTRLVKPETDLHANDCVDEEEHRNEQDDVRQRLHSRCLSLMTTSHCANILPYVHRL